MKFIGAAILVLVLSSLYLVFWSRKKMPWLQKHKWTVNLSFVVFLILQILGPVLFRMYPSRLNEGFILYWVSYMSLGVFACLFCYAAVVDVLGRLYLFVCRWLMKPSDGVSLDRRSFFAVGALTAGSSAVGALQVVAGPQVYNIDISIPTLPKEFQDFRILQITDLHVGPTIGRHYVENVVKMVNDLKPHLIVLTGDMIDGEVAHLQEQVAPLKDLQSSHGVLYVTGNHEYFWGVETWIREFALLGARPLVNEHVILKKDGAQILVAGIADLHAERFGASHKADIGKSLEGAPSENLVKILLAHQPGSYQEAADHGFDLQISGHTHGGQFFPWSLLVAVAHRYYKGLYRHENTWVYVSRGTGYWGPPIRFGVPSEITLFRLKGKTSAIDVAMDS